MVGTLTNQKTTFAAHLQITTNAGLITAFEKQMKLVCSEELAKLQHGGFQYQFAHLAILRQLPSRVMESMKMTKRDTSEILPCKLSLSSWQS